MCNTSQPVIYRVHTSRISKECLHLCIVQYMYKDRNNRQTDISCICPALNISTRSCQEARNTLSSHTRLEKTVLTCRKICCEKYLYCLLRKMPLLPGFLHWQLAYESAKTGYLAGWILSRSFAPPLRTRLDSTTLKSAPNPHQTPKSPIYRLIQRLGRPKPARGHLSPRIGDRWRLSRVDSHSHWMPIVLPTAS